MQTASSRPSTTREWNAEAAAHLERLARLLLRILQQAHQFLVHGRDVHPGVHDAFFTQRGQGQAHSQTRALAENVNRRHFRESHTGA